MNRLQHILCRFGEECNETAQRVSKALVFGRLERQPNQDKTNAQRLRDEMTDLAAVWMLYCKEVGEPHGFDNAELEKKWAKVEHFIRYSKEQGQLTGDAEPPKVLPAIPTPGGIIHKLTHDEPEGWPVREFMEEAWKEQDEAAEDAKRRDEIGVCDKCGVPNCCLHDVSCPRYVAPAVFTTTKMAAPICPECKADTTHEPHQPGCVYSFQSVSGSVLVKAPLFDKPTLTDEEKARVANADALGWTEIRHRIGKEGAWVILGKRPGCSYEELLPQLPVKPARIVLESANRPD